MEDMAKQQQSDHDLLITLNTKVDGLAMAVGELKDGIYTRVGALETRLKMMEDSHAGIDTRAEVERIRENHEKVEELEKRWRIIAWLLAPIYITLTGLILNRAFEMF